MERYIEDKKNLYSTILEFLEESDEIIEFNDEHIKESFQKLIKVINGQQIEGDAEEMRYFLEIIKSIGEHHHQNQLFNKKMNQLLLHYKDQIKQTLPNLEIFHIFENNKKIVLFLLKNDILTITDEIYIEMVNKIDNNENRYCHFFIPELENFVGEEKMKFIKNELLKEDPSFFSSYEEKRQEGENDSYICSLIRHDSVEEFISHVNRHNISPLSQITSSIFETNYFLNENKNISLIEYSAFFGSIQIFQYLLLNKAELTPALWFYAIHSKNAELIHLLESNEIPPPKTKKKGEEKNSTKNYEQCLIESIKCHHNDIAEYIENNLIDQMGKNSQQNEEIISNCIKYHNYWKLQNDEIIDYGFFYLCFYHYDKLVKLLLQKKEKLIQKKTFKYSNIRNSSEKNEVEVVYNYLLKMNKIHQDIFNGTNVKQVAIPSSITSIGNLSFFGCSLLTQISIPSSVTSIGYLAFSKCSSLKQITIPSSVVSIGNDAFSGCSSLKRIIIPSSVVSIGYRVFSECSSLEQISNLSSATSIRYCTFSGCSSLKQITIPSSVTSIGEFAFFKCRSLTQITIPSSVTLIGKSAFKRCSKLKQISIPSSVISIENDSFYECLSLSQIIIPSSVTNIGNSAFLRCSSLTEIIIPSSVTSIGYDAFSGCSSLTQITIPSSVTSIGNFAFYECSSLKQITIPSSVTSIGYLAFIGCSSLEQISIPSSINTEKLGINPWTNILNST